MPTAVPASLAIGDFITTEITGDVGKWIGFGEWLDSASFAHPFNRELRELDVFSHAAVYVGNGNIVEAEVGGARLHSLDEYLDGRPILFSTDLLGIDAATGQKIADAATAMIGAKYSIIDYVVIAAKRFKLWAPFLKRYVNSSKRVICSQLVSLAYDSAGAPLFPGTWPGFVTPLDLARLLVSKGARP